ncbi:transglycosylase SLT domain-containing protein [candidate division FCPU426 bacterium]|nr:transglycosylase SLT domain-containing protein [candidate division FCPU426 bacterium]
MFFKDKKHAWWLKIIVVKTTAVVLFTVILLFDVPSLRVSAAILGNRPGWWLRMQPRTDSVRIWRELDYVAINRHFESLKTPFPQEMIKAIAWCESEWRHFDEYGQSYVSVNIKYLAPASAPAGMKTGRIKNVTYDLGLMQINEKSNSLDPCTWDLVRIKNDPEYNLQAGVRVLEKKRAYVRYLQKKKNWPEIERRYHLRGRSELEITLKAYNGFRTSWNYVNRIQNLMAERPWEQAMLKELEAKGKRKCDGLKYSLGREKTLVQPGWANRYQGLIVKAQTPVLAHPAKLILPAPLPEK